MMTFREIADKAYSLYCDELVPSDYKYLLLDLYSWANVRDMRMVRGLPAENWDIKSEDVPF